MDPGGTQPPAATQPPMSQLPPPCTSTWVPCAHPNGHVGQFLERGDGWKPHMLRLPETSSWAQTSPQKPLRLGKQPNAKFCSYLMPLGKMSFTIKVTKKALKMNHTSHKAASFLLASSTTGSYLTWPPPVLTHRSSCINPIWINVLTLSGTLCPRLKMKK